MEQQLIDVMNKAESIEDIDEVSKAMIMSRVFHALEQVRDTTQQYLEKLESIQKEHDFELKLAGLAVVLNVTDDIASKALDGPAQLCVIGNKTKILDNVKQIMENI